MLSKLLFYLLVLLLLSGFAAWFASGSGEMVLEWENYELTTTTSNFVFLMVIVVVIFSVVIPGISGLFALPKKWLKERDNRKFRHGLEHVTAALTAISLGDSTQAHAAISRVRRTLPNQPVIPLLETQLAAVSKDQALLQKSLRDLQQFDQTKALASKGLAEMHLRKGEVSSALPYAQQAMELDPKNKQSVLMTLALYVQSKQYLLAENLIEDSRKQRVLDKNTLRELQAMLAYLRSKQEENNPLQAREFISKAYALAPENCAIYSHYISLHQAPEVLHLAQKALKKSWQSHFTPVLFDLAKQLPLKPGDRKKLYHKLAEGPAQARAYAHVLLASQAADEQDQKQAIKHLERFNEIMPQPVLMPDKYAMHDISYHQQLIDSLAAAQQLLAKTKWECGHCMRESPEWMAVCTGCQAVNSYKAVQSQTW